MIIFLRKKKKEPHSSRSKMNKFKITDESNSIRMDSKLSVINIDKIAKKIEHEPALIRIGKNGISESIILELRKLIPLKKAVKVKILQNAPIDNVKTFFEELEGIVGYKIWRIKGNTAIFISRKYN